jgi:hypothetical protein
VGAEEIGILVYSGMFIVDDPGLLALIRAKATQGVDVRILVGDPDAEEIAVRGTHEGIDEALAFKIRNALVVYGSLRDTEGIEIRQHATVLFNSIYRADDELLVNSHIYGAPAAEAPVMHLRRVAGGAMVNTYLKSFDRVWAESRPLD